MIQVSLMVTRDAKTAVNPLLSWSLKQLGLPPEERKHEETGRPVLASGLHLSVSHTSGAAAVALGDTPVGLDLERLRPVKPGLARRVLSDGEYAWFLENGARQEDFLTLWTLKESYYKYLGTGLPGFPNKTDFFPENGQWKLRGQPLRFWTQKNGLLFLTLCGTEQEVNFRIYPES